MPKMLFFLLISFLIGCSSIKKPTDDKQFVQVYAELSLLHEKEKMIAKSSDSLYQVKVKDFLAKKGMSEEEFRSRSNDVMKDYKVWQLFLTDVSKAVDSLKSVGK